MSASPPPPSSRPPAKAPVQTDVRSRRAVPPSTLQNLRLNSTTGGGAGGAGRGELDLTSDEYLDKVEEELNRRVDADVDSLVEGMKELVHLARLPPPAQGLPHPSQPSHSSLSSTLRTQSMIRSAHSLLSLAHNLKLLHLFGDAEAGSSAREAKEERLTGEIARLKTGAAELAGGGARVAAT
ncbi:hypothetical protein JCM11251_007051 [Rhodosporidiobolus azoricus]